MLLVPSDAVKTAMAKETLGPSSCAFAPVSDLYSWLVGSFDDGWAPRWGSFESWATVLTAPNGSLALLCPSTVELLCPLCNSFKRNSVGALGDQVFRNLNGMKAKFSPIHVGW
jgi:hypothetical protein